MGAALALGHPARPLPWLLNARTRTRQLEEIREWKQPWFLPRF